MGIGRSVIKGLKDRIMKSYGEKIVTNIADTSSDAPNKFSVPKRDLYDKLKDEGQIPTDGKKDR